MRLTFFLLTAFILNVSAKGVSQTVSFSGRDVPLEQIFSMVKEQTGYVFFYNEHLLKGTRPISIEARKMPLQGFLRQIFKDQPVMYTMQSRSISISRKPGGTIPYYQEQPAQEDAPNSMLYAVVPITGIVRSQDGQPLAGATIRVKGGNSMVMSNKEGGFSINIQQDQLLVISYIGYETQEVKAVAGTVNMIVLIAKNNEIDSVSVVSTGYQKIPRYQLTGAASVLNQKEYDQRVAVTGNFLENLEGKVPGLVYNSQSGELSIRGVATFSAVKQPLIIVDGFPTEIDLRTINPNDVVSISVLRDAAASAIYGVRASNGVIVVETRRGKNGKTVFNFRASTATQDRPDFSYLKYAPAGEYVQLENSKIIAGNQFSLLSYYDLSGYPLTPIETNALALKNGTITQAQSDAKLAAIGSYDNLQEYSDLFYQRRLSNNLNFDMSGGNERNTYMLGFNYVGDKQNNVRSRYQQYLVTVANNYQINRRMKFNFKGVYSNGKNENGLTPSYSSFYPYEHLADANGRALPMVVGTLSGSGRSYSINAVTPATNKTLLAAGLYDELYYPYRELTSNTTTIKRASIQLQGMLNVKINRWLNMDIGGNYENQDARTDFLQKEDAMYTRLLLNVSALKDGVTGRPVFSNIPQGDILKRTAQKATNYTVRGQLNLNELRFGNNEHSISAIIGIEQKRIAIDTFTTSFFGYDGQTLISKPLNMPAFNSTGISSSAFPAVGTVIISHKSTDYFYRKNNDNRFMSYYGNATYMFRDKYIATGGARLDQSNLFGSDPRYRNKPLWSAGLAWLANKENFLNNVNWIDELKLRAATGFTGNIPATNNGKFLLLSSALNTNFAVAQTYYTVTSPKNESLRWETTRNQNLGVDYALFNNRIIGSIDWYRKKSVDVFGSIDSDPTSGFNSYNSNSASIVNKGLEFQITGTSIRRRNFSWITTVTASFNHNEVVAVKATTFSNSSNITTSSQNIVGKPMSALYSYNYGGLTALGQPYVLDNKGNKKILAFPSVDVTINDLIYNGTTVPKYTLGFNNQLTFGAFDISVLFMYYGGHVTRVEAPSANSILNPSPIQGASNYWKQPGDEANTMIPALPKGSSVAVGYYSSYAPYGYYYASQFVRKADYIRIRDLIVTYNIKSELLRKTGLQQPQLRFQAQNLYRYTFSGNDIDPEAINRASGLRSLPVRPMLSLSFFGKF